MFQIAILAFADGLEEVFILKVKRLGHNTI
jgi:hypothetical protein